MIACVAIIHFLLTIEFLKLCKHFAASYDLVIQSTLFQRVEHKLIIVMLFESNICGLITRGSIFRLGRSRTRAMTSVSCCYDVVVNRSQLSNTFTRSSSRAVHR